MQCSKFPGGGVGGKKQGFKNGPVRSILVDIYVQLDWTMDWTTCLWTLPHTGTLLSVPDHTMDCPIFKISWEGQKQGLKNGPVRSILVDHL